MKEYILILDSILGNGWFKILIQGVPYPSCHEPKKPPLDRETSVRTKYFSFCWILNLPCNNWFEFDVNQIVILSLSSSKYKKLKFFWVVILSSYSCSQRYRFQGRKKGVFFFFFHFLILGRKWVGRLCIMCMGTHLEYEISDLYVLLIIQ